MANILGNNLVVRVGTTAAGDVILCSTSCSLNLTQATTEASCKGDPDDGGNKWSNAIAGTASWSITTDGLYNPTITSFSYDYCADVIINDANGTAVNEVDLVFEIYDSASATTGDVTFYSGTAIVTSAVLNGPVDEFATYTVEFKGVGALAQNLKTA